ncbi:hypothetical protein HZA40_03620 [Candidatus Peregrinibacteria bacterium]|nr:hypothetical protein [Candidatus Peregrinibacteria bacterium]
MGAGGKKPPMKEIDETRAAGRDEAFENIINRVKAAGAEIVLDEISPLYTEIGNQEFEIGSERIVQFNLARLDFKLSRRVENQSIQGEGHQKHLTALTTPRIKLTLRRKPDNTQDWQVVDLEDMF